MSAHFLACILSGIEKCVYPGLTNGMKKIYWALVVIAVIAVVGYFKMGSKSLPYVGYQGASSPSPSSSPVKTVYKPKAKSAPTSNSDSGTAMAYTDLVKQYTDRRIQFDDNCQTTPSAPTYKNNTSILLDNRSATARVVSVNGVKYQLGGYGYKVITLSSTTLPREMSVDCGSRYNVGRILLQAKIYGY